MVPERAAGPIWINCAARTARLGARPLQLTPKGFDLLAYLATRPNEAVSKADIRVAVWPDASVDESNITQTVFMLRRALRDAGCAAKLIETVPRVGYRLVVPAAPADMPAAPDQTRRLVGDAEAIRLPVHEQSPADPATTHASSRRRARSTAWWIAAAVTALVALAASVGPAMLRPAGIRSVAIVPFANGRSAAEQFLADGITDQISHELARATHVRLAPRGQNADAPVALGRRLDVDAVLTGGVRGDGQALTASATLRDTRTGRVLWQAEQRGSASELGGRRGAGALLSRDLLARLWPDAPAPEVRERASAAHLAYLRARSLLARRTPDAIEQAIAAFREAIAHDPAHGEAYAGLADAYALSGVFGVLPRETAYPTAKEFATQALRLDDQLAEAHTSLAFVLQVWEKQWAEAELRYQRAIELDPANVQAHHWYALLLDSTVRPADALREIDAAIALAPLAPNINSDKGMILAHHQRVDEAIAQFQKTLAIDPSYADAQMEMGWTLARAGRHEEALAAFEKAKALGVPPAQVLAGRGYALAKAGRRGEARAIYEAIRRAPDILDRQQREVLLALVLMGLGDPDEAVRRLLAGLPEGEPNAKVGYWEIREHPGYQEFLRRSGF